jgi:hypothetical protein
MGRVMPEKTKATTLQQKFGFVDSDLKTPKHDEIMIWLDAKMAEIVAKLEDQQWTQRLIEEVKERYQDFVRQNRVEPPKLGNPPEKPPIHEISKKWEHPITTGSENKFTVGFVDMAVSYSCPSLSVTGLELKYDDRGRALGFKTTPSWQIIHCGTKKVFFEVKTSIKSIGELTRQIRMYQVHEKEARFIVVSPDDHAEKVLKSQGIGFLKYTGDQEKLKL